MKKLGWMFAIVLAAAPLAGCEQKKPPPQPDKPGVDVKAPGVDVKTGGGGVEVKTPAADVEVKK